MSCNLVLYAHINICPPKVMQKYKKVACQTKKTTKSFLFYRFFRNFATEIEIHQRKRKAKGQWNYKEKLSLPCQNAVA